MVSSSPRTVTRIPGHHLHIIGCSTRSGTTLLHHLIRTCFNIDDTCSHEVSAYHVRTYPGAIYCSKYPHDTPFIEPLLRINPNFYCICLIRDPRDVIVSKHRNFKHAYHSNLRVWKHYTGFAQKLRNHPRLMFVRYEDLVSQPDHVQQAIRAQFDFLEQRRPFSRAHEVDDVDEQSRRALHGWREVSTDSIGRWQAHPQRVADQIWRHGSIDETLQYWGYESSTAWKDNLPAPSSSMEDSKLQENLGVKKRVTRKWRQLSRWLRYFLRYFMYKKLLGR